MRRGFDLLGFNPRAREGRDGQKSYALVVERCFNPRAREGRDYRNWDVVV